MTPAEARPGRLGVGVVGAGRVGAVLGNGLRGAGHPVVGVSAISAASRERAEALLPGVPVNVIAGCTASGMTPAARAGASTSTP